MHVAQTVDEMRSNHPRHRNISQHPALLRGGGGGGGMPIALAGSVGPGREFHGQGTKKTRLCAIFVSATLRETPPVHPRRPHRHPTPSRSVLGPSKTGPQFRAQPLRATF
jgi:hypothetical protein